MTVANVFAFCPLLLTLATAQDRDFDPYRIASRQDEIGLARSAAPESISKNAEVLVLGTRGYETAVRGENGFTCIVVRSWANNPDDPEFWNPKIRAPICYNAPATRSVLPQYLKRTEWVLAGVSPASILDRIKSTVAKKQFPAPEPSSMCYMLSMRGYLNDKAGHWLPHLMLFLPRTEAAGWGANLAGAPVMTLDTDPEPVTVLLIPVRNWSDGSPAPAEPMR